MMVSQHRIDDLDAEYAPLLSDLQAALESEIGPLRWADVPAPRQLTLIEGEDVVRVGPISGFGVPLPVLDLQRLTEVVNDVLVKHEFEPGDPLTGSRTGHLIMMTKDAGGRRFTFMAKVSAEAWVDIAADGSRLQISAD